MLWEVLACLESCEVDRMRGSGWSYEVAIVENADGNAWNKYVLWRTESLGRRTFATQGQCLRALRRAYPKGARPPTERGEIDTYTHYPDYIEGYYTLPYVMNATGFLACFRRAPLTS